MTITNINTSEDQSQYIGQVYQEYYAKLRHYFLTQLGDEAIADDCVQETMRRFFFFMEDRNWEAEAEYVSVYLMRIAGFIYSRKLAEKTRKHAQRLDDETNRLFPNLRDLAVQVMKERVEFMQFVLRPINNRNR